MAARQATERIIDLATPYVRSASPWTAQPGCLEITSRWSRVPRFPILRWENVGMLCLIIVSVKPSLEDGCVSSTSQGRRILLMYSPNL
eukprot:scaffold11305_cov122-Amphora_coffeaeformis.AAC.1